MNVLLAAKIILADATIDYFMALPYSTMRGAVKYAASFDGSKTPFSASAISNRTNKEHMAKATPAKDPAHIALIKARITECESACNNLGQQIQRSQQFIDETKTQFIHTKGKLEGLQDLLKTLETPAAPAETK